MSFIRPRELDFFVITRDSPNQKTQLSWGGGGITKLHIALMFMNQLLSSAIARSRALLTLQLWFSEQVEGGHG